LRELEIKSQDSATSGTSSHWWAPTV
jgi:hypothetical protein